MANSKRGRFYCEASSSSMDQISMLPDEILGLILSFLTHKEATTTSILCHRWKYLWILTPKLDLDGSHSLRKVKMSVPKESVPENEAALGIKKYALEKERSKYLRWIDRVIFLHQSMHKKFNLEEFRVSFDLSSSHAEWIDNGLDYALSRKVRSLDLNLIDVKADQSRKCYDFPYKYGNFPNNFKLMKKLSLHYVNVTGEAVEFFLANCPLLEKVSVSESQVLESLKIIQTFPSFKCLEISLCNNLKSIEVRDSHVVTIKYSGRRIHSLLVDVPLVTELWIRGLCLNDVFSMFHSVLPQLQTFKLYVTYPLSWTESRKFFEHVDMCNLKQMVVSLENGFNDKDSDLLRVILFSLSAAPRLERFVLEAPHQPIKGENLLDDASAAAFTGVKYRLIPRAYFHLKEVEFVGYRGVKNQFQAMMHLVANVEVLRNIVVDTRCFKLRSHRPWDRIPRHKIEDGITARAYAKKQLKENVGASKINVKIL